jgi:chromosome segregation ATPase
MIPYTTIPFISAFFLVLVGVLMAHLLWYRTRDHQGQVVFDLEKKNEDLRASLQTQMGEYVQLKKELAETRQDRAQQQQRGDQIQTQLQQRQQKVQHLEQQLSRLQRESGKRRQRLERIERQLADRRQRLEQIQQQAVAAESDLSSGQRRLDESQERQRDLQAELRVHPLRSATFSVVAHGLAPSIRTIVPLPTVR